MTASPFFRAVPDVPPLPAPSGLPPASPEAAPEPPSERAPEAPAPLEAPAVPDAAPVATPLAPHRGWAWWKVIGVSLVAALFLRAFAFEAFRIPSSSMEETLLVGDFLFVSKLHYGPRTPLTVGVPFSDHYLRDVALPSARLPGFTRVARGDVVVFNFPPQAGPTDRKEHYVKRVAGLPGDTVAVVGKHVLVGGEAMAMPASAQQLWRVRLASDTLSAADVLPMGAVRGQPSRDRPEWLVEATGAEAEQIGMRPGVAWVQPFVRPAGDRSAAFPLGRPYTLDDWGPVVVPRRGLTIPLDDATWPIYRDAITRFEGVRAQRVAGGFEVAGALTDRYTFRADYLFVLGDNRDDSADSRTWGFVPESHLVGKAVLVYFSWDADAEAPRWDRMLRRVE